MSLIKEIVTHWRKSRRYREDFLESTDRHIGAMREDQLRWCFAISYIILSCLFFWDTLGSLLGGGIAGVLINGAFLVMSASGVARILHLWQMLKTAHEYALNNSRPL